KLLFMGGEIGQWHEWSERTELDWFLLGDADHAGLKRLVGDLNRVFKQYGALHELDDDPEGFRWVDANDALQSVASFLRFPKQPPLPPAQPGEAPRGPLPKGKGKHVVFVGNFTPVLRTGYRVGVPRKCRYLEVLNTDALAYGGGGVGNMGAVEAEERACHGLPYSVSLTLPPLAALYLVPELEDDPGYAPPEPAGEAPSAKV
ncbi:MAG TPA: alpha amylase C-terminal domain-containing protein, partial [Minicystis sp.]|nr:alpha amylase C-terminal domain-containing protein [Minicystis sp.]